MKGHLKYGKTKCLETVGFLQGNRKNFLIWERLTEKEKEVRYGRKIYASVQDLLAGWQKISDKSFGIVF